MRLNLNQVMSTVTPRTPRIWGQTPRTGRTDPEPEEPFGSPQMRLTELREASPDLQLTTTASLELSRITNQATVYSTGLTPRGVPAGGVVSGKFCGACGHMVPAGMAYCTNCGQKVVSLPPTQKENGPVSDVAGICPPIVEGRAGRSQTETLAACE